MNVVIIIVVFVGVFVVLLSLQKRGQTGKPTAPPPHPPLPPLFPEASVTPEIGPWPYHARNPLSPPELELYARLCRALPGHIVLAQVGLSRILGVNKGANFGEWYNRISQMSVDFVICTRDGAVLTVIELDDSSHGRMNRPEADAKKDKALAAAGIPLIRWNVKAIPDEGTIQRALATGYALR